jgi:uncharacterized membrane protein YuzA (DUF378 family)
MGIAVLGGLGATFVTLVATITGSYQMAYVIGIVGWILVGLCTIVALGQVKNLKAKWEEEVAEVAEGN